MRIPIFWGFPILLYTMIGLSPLLAYEEEVPWITSLILNGLMAFVIGLFNSTTPMKVLALVITTSLPLLFIHGLPDGTVNLSSFALYWAGVPIGILLMKKRALPTDGPAFLAREVDPQ